jgi:hypothetical protein
MSLDLYLESKEMREVECACPECGHSHKKMEKTIYYTSNITHNLTAMFNAAGVYQILWRGDGLMAGEQVEKLEKALKEMKENPEKFKRYDSPNGWGLYVHAVPWLAEVVQACKDYPEAVFHCSR